MKVGATGSAGAEIEAKEEGSSSQSFLLLQMRGNTQAILFGKHKWPYGGNYDRTEKLFRVTCGYWLKYKLKIRAATMKAIPSMFYGTAWKKERTAELVSLALKNGFRAIDTACQPKHYNQPGVGQGIAASGIDRKDIFLQTKYTPIGGQDPNNVPYDPKSPLKTQVKTSLQASLHNLRTDYLDSLVLHSPMPTLQKTLQVWSVFEEFVQEGKVRALGISNCYSLPFFKELYKAAKVKPSFLQNRFYKESGYDIELREFCRENKVRYQSFWTLTANPHILASQIVRKLCQKYKKNPQQLFYAVLMNQGFIVLNGTTSEAHMREDLEILGFEVEEADRKQVMALCR